MSLVSRLCVLLACFCVLPSLGAQNPRPLPFPNLDIWASGAVRAVAATPDGGFVIGGDFTLVQGLARRNLAKIMANGLVDPNWNPLLAGSFPSVQALAVASNGDVYIGGDFESVGGVLRNRLAKLSASGVLDSNWDPAAVDGISNARILALALAGDQLIVGGRFTFIGGQSRNRLAKLSTSGAGAADPAWNPSSLSSDVHALAFDGSQFVYLNQRFDGLQGVSRIAVAGSGAADANWNVLTDAAVSAMALGGNDSIYIGGSFTLVQSTARSGLARLGTASQAVLDPAWTPAVAGYVQTLLRVGSDLYVAGRFSSIAGESRTQLARVGLLGSGVVDPGWMPSALGGSVNVMARESSGRIIVGGEFTQINAQARSGLAVLDGASGAPSAATDVEQPVRSLAAMATLPDQSLLIGGRFSRIGGFHRQNLVRLLPGGSVDTAWGADVQGVAVPYLQPPGEPGGFDYVISVWKLLVDAAGRVYVGGTFEQVGGVSRRNLARIGTDGQLDLGWVADADGAVAAMAFDASEQLLVGGNFSTLAGQPRGSLAKLGTGAAATLDASWVPTLSLGALPSVLLPDGAGSVFLGGAFNVVNGENCCTGIAKLSATGAGLRDTSWNINLSGSQRSINALALDGAGNIYLAGNFSGLSQAGNSFVRQGLARALASGAGDIDPVWSPQQLAFGYASLALPGDGRIYVVSGIWFPGWVFALSTSGTGLWDQSWNVTSNGSLFQILAAGNTLYVGGSFTAIGGQPRQGIAAFPLDGLFGDGLEDRVQ